jgi:hypothetical protein
MGVRAAAHRGRSAQLFAFVIHSTVGRSTAVEYFQDRGALLTFYQDQFRSLTHQPAIQQV